MGEKKRISCCVIGHTKIAIDCSKLLLENEFDLTEVFTDDPQFKKWSSSYRLSVNSISTFRKCMKIEKYFQKFDMLFSIVNDVFISPNVLSSVKLVSVNYHNGPLPMYAGCNAVNWALINGEISHGVSWHIINETVDTGRVLAQHTFRIDDQDMLFDVNSKCNDAAVTSFNQVCAQLTSLCSPPLVSQDNKLISYYGLNLKPTPFCLLPLWKTAKEVFNFFRGTFHQYGINELGVPKLLLPHDSLVVISKMKICSDLLKMDQQAGTVVSVSSDNLIITTAGKSCISIEEFTRLDGTSFPKPFYNSLGYLEGHNLSVSKKLQQLSDYSKNMGKNARKWGKRLLLQQSRGNEISLEWPYYCYGPQPDYSSEDVLRRITTLCDINLCNICPKILFKTPELSILSSFLIFLLCLSPSNPVYVDVMFDNIPKENSSFFVPFVPILLQVSPKNSFCKNLDVMTDKLDSVLYASRECLPPSDLFLCYPMISKHKNSIAICGSSFPVTLSNHKLVIQCLRDESKVSLLLHYQTSNFNSRNFSSVAADFMGFLAAVSCNPSKKLFSYSLCNELALKKSSTLKGRSGYAFPCSLHQPFNEAAKKFPHAVAIIDKNGQYTYSELDSKIDDIAHLIATKCRVKVKRAVLILDRTWLSIAAMLAVLRLGATVVPIEKSWPKHRIEQIVSDCTPEIAVFESVPPVSKLYQPSLFPCAVFLDYDLTNCCGKHYNSTSETAYILYTSGTTGKPKGVVLHHAGLCNILEHFKLTTNYKTKTLLDTDGEYSAHSTPYSFDTFFLEIFPVLWTNGTVLTLPVNPLEIVHLTGGLRYVTSLVTQPTKLAFFKPVLFQSANKVTFGGEAPSMGILEPWLKYQVPNRKLWNAYGPTEGSVITTLGHITDSIHLGQCTGNAELKILNSSKQVLPVGVAGELHIAGCGVASGYTDPTLSKAVFWECDGVKCYKTGDLVYLDDQGLLHFLGRILKDRQVKIGGVRIELFEIEQALRSLHGIQFVQVKQRKGRLVAYIHPQSLNVDVIKESLAKILPPHMVPSIIIFLPRESITFNNSGKLVLLEEASSQLSRALSNQDGKMASILSKCFDGNIPSFDKSLLSCGIDSLSVLYLTSQIESTFGCSLRPSDIIEKTPSELLSQFCADEEDGDTKRLVKVSSVEKDLNPNENSQKLLANAATYNSISALNQILAGPTYNVPIVYRICGKINCMLLSHALETALSRIRDAYRKDSKHGSGCEHSILHVDLSSYSSEPRYDAAINCCQRDALQMIDFKSCLPYLCKLFYLGSNKYIVSIIIHHIAFDFSSLRLVENIVEAVCMDKYSQASIVEDFDNYLTFLTKHAEMWEKDYKYWSQYLKNCNLFVDTPVTYPRNNACPFVGKHLPGALTERISKRIEDICTTLSIDPAAVFLCLFSLTLFNLSCKADFGVGVSFSLRAEPELKKVIGYLANTVLFCFSEELLRKPFSILLQDLQSWIEESIAHATFPLHEATKLCKKEPGFETSPSHYTPQFLFNFLSSGKKELSLGNDVTTEFVHIETYTSKAEIMLDVQSSGQLFEYTWEYSTALFSLEAMQHINCVFIKLMDRFLAEINSTFYTCNLMLASTSLSHQSELNLASNQDEILLPVSSFHQFFLDKITKLPLQDQNAFHSTASVAISCSGCSQHIANAMVSQLSDKDYLRSQLYAENNTWFLQVSRESKFIVNFESVASARELKAVKLRDSLWPFNLFRAPLFRITVIEHMYTSPRSMEVFVVAHQALLNEASVVHLAVFLANSVTDSPVNMNDLHYSSSVHKFPCESSAMKLSDEVRMEWIQSESRQQRMPSLSISSNSCITSYLTLQVPTEKLDEWTEAIWCSLIAVFLYEVTKAHSVEFAFLKSVCSPKLTFYEEIIPMSTSTDPDFTVTALHAQFQKQLSLLESKMIPYYWEMQEQVDPFLSLSKPYHEVLFHIVTGGSCKSTRSSSFRPFSIAFTLNFMRCEISLETKLPPLQTNTLQKSFEAVFSIFTTPNSHLLSLLNFSLEVEKVSRVHISRRDGTSNTNYGRVCYVTMEEAFRLVSLFQHKILTKIAECKEKIEHIAVFMTNSLELPLSLIAITLCQHAFLILDPYDSTENLEKKLIVSNTSCVLCNFESIDRIEEITRSCHSITSIFVSAYSPDLEESTCCDLQQASLASEDKPAFIVFTSGTTGDPKLVSVTEKSLVNFLLWDVWACLKQNNCVQLMHNQFDVFIAEVLGQFLSESTLYLIDWAHRLDGQYLWKFIRHYGIDTMYSTPTILSLLLNQHASIDGSSQCWNSQCFTSLRHVLLAGERVSNDLCALFFRRFPPGSVPVFLHNWGGPCECCIGYSHCIVNQLSSADCIPMGHLIPNSSLMIANEKSHNVLPIGLPGEVLVSGACCQKQVIDGNCIQIQGKLWFATGDIGFLNEHGQVVLLHRSDSQVKIASQRVELCGIRASILFLELPGIVDVIVDIATNASGMELVCFLVVSDQKFERHNYQEDLQLRLNAQHVPRVVEVFWGNELPRLLSGKVNMKHLKELAKTSAIAQKATTTPESVIAILQKCIKVIMPRSRAIPSLLWLTLDSLGMSSLNKAQLHQMLNNEGFEVSMDAILMSHNLLSLASFIKCSAAHSQSILHTTMPSTVTGHEGDLVGIFGMGVHLPQASTCDEFWDIIVNAKEVISHDLPDLTNIKPHVGKYIGSRGLIKDMYEFDNALFGIPQGRAEMLDPQQRLLLQLVYSTLEESGIDPAKETENTKIGCFAAVEFPRHLLNCVMKDPEKTDELIWENLRDNTALNIGKFFDFRGPCVTLTNNCSSVAVAVHYARLSLMNRDCDVAVVVGACIYGQETGYYTHENDIYSKDGHCRPFSKSCSGTVMSDGASVILLKRVCLANDKDNLDDIICWVRGTSVSSDGAFSGSHQLVPSGKGQIANLINVLEASSTDPNAVELIEAHGTGTKVGDCVEIESLGVVFGNSTEKARVIGSLKGNFGHLGVGAAGPSIIKVAMALKQNMFPPSINCDDPITSLKKGKFVILSRPQPWTTTFGCRTALVHSVGAVGTNAAIILEEYSSCRQHDKSNTLKGKCLPFCLSTQSLKSLKDYSLCLLDFLQCNTEMQLNDILYSLSAAKRYCSLRVSDVFTSKLELADWLRNFRPDTVKLSKKQIPVLVSFSGQGESVEVRFFRFYCNLLPHFQDYLESYCHILEENYPKQFPRSAFKLLYNCDDSFARQVNLKTSLQQILTIIFQLAIYFSLNALGLEVSGAFGHSLGEYSAACIAGVLTAEETLLIVFQRALLIERYASEGKMLHISMNGEEVMSKYVLSPSIQVAAINSSSSSVFSGPPDDIHALYQQLKKDKVKVRYLDSMAYAYHHRAMLDIARIYKDTLQALKSQQQRSTAKMLITSIKGRVKLYCQGDKFDLLYFAHHLHTPVNYYEAMNLIVNPTFQFANVVEIGIKPLLRAISNSTVLNSWVSVCLKHEEKFIMSSLCSVWEAGIDIHLHKLLVFKGAHQVALPTYRFDLQHCNFMSQQSDIATYRTNSYVSSGSCEVTPEDVFHYLSPFCDQVGTEFFIPVDSLAIAALCERVFIRYKVEVVNMIENSSLDEIVNYIAKQSNNLFGSIKPPAQSIESPIQPLLSSGNQRSDKNFLFICHGVTGKRFSFVPLATVISFTFEIYGIHVPISILSDAKITSIQMVAAYYVEQIKLLQPEGPYFLSGFSFGAWIAHSIVGILQEQGDAISKLILIDPVSLDFSLTQSPTQQDALSAKLFVGLNSEAVQSVNKHVVAQYFDDFQLQMQYLKTYKETIKPLKIEVTLLIASEGISSNHILNPEAWKEVCLDNSLLKMHEIPGSHDSCLFPLNCIHIAKHFIPEPIKQTIFVASESAHLVGSWRLHDETSCNVKSGFLRFNSSGTYNCMVNCMVPQVSEMDSLLEENESALLNSAGHYKVRDNKLIFEVEFSFPTLSHPRQQVDMELAVDNGIGNLMFKFVRTALSWCYSTSDTQ